MLTWINEKLKKPPMILINGVNGICSEAPMRSSLLCLGSVLMILLSPNISRSQEIYSEIYHLYYALFESPEFGDQILNERSYLLEDWKFDDCMGLIVDFWQERSQNHFQFCDQIHSDPEFWAQCLQENEPAKTVRSLRQIWAAAHGEFMWSATDTAIAGVWAKQYDPGLYLYLVRTLVPLYRPYLECRYGGS